MKQWRGWKVGGITAFLLIALSTLISLLSLIVFLTLNNNLDDLAFIFQPPDSHTFSWLLIACVCLCTFCLAGINMDFVSAWKASIRSLEVISICDPWHDLLCNRCNFYLAGSMLITVCCVELNCFFEICFIALLINNKPSHQDTWQNKRHRSEMFSRFFESSLISILLFIHFGLCAPAVPFASLLLCVCVLMWTWVVQCSIYNRRHTQWMYSQAFQRDESGFSQQIVCGGESQLNWAVGTWGQRPDGLGLQCSLLSPCLINKVNTARCVCACVYVCGCGCCCYWWLALNPVRVCGTVFATLLCLCRIGWRCMNSIGLQMWSVCSK